jgi:hypothetical protein
MSGATKQESKFVLQERGYFWWAEERIPANSFAPASAVTGTLTVHENGQIDLELDAVLVRDNVHVLEAVLFAPEDALEGRRIRGLLKEGDRHILLEGIRYNGGRASNAGISFSRIAALICLVGARPFPTDDTKIRIRSIEVSLKGYEEWLGRGGIKTKRTKHSLIAKHQVPKPHRYDISGGRLSIATSLTGPYDGKIFHHALSVEERHSLRLYFQSPKDIESTVSEYRQIEDFLILLTGSDYTPEDWPIFEIGAVKSPKRYRAYFFRLKSSANPPSLFDCWTHFLGVAAQFGALFDQWRIKREHYGPGFYLFLGTKRGMKLYAEHRFVNLIWGLESLHRRGGVVTKKPNRLEEKIARILSAIQIRKDRAWLEGRLQHAGEPSLEERLAALFSTLPLGLETPKVRAFAKRCADARNDVSHFGGQREKGQDYSMFVRELLLLSEIVAYFYHSLLLSEIGINDDHLRWHFYDGFRSHAIQKLCVDADLLDRAVLAARRPVAGAVEQVPTDANEGGGSSLP